jgi:hypothetical protein
MVLGFNHNIRYKGELFHVQTEDSGRANPHIVTLLYRGGTILASSKTTYADIIKVDQLEQVVESIMKEQHKEMMKRLKAGEFDARIFPGQAAAVQASAPQDAAAPAPVTPAPADVAPPRATPPPQAVAAPKTVTAPPAAMQAAPIPATAPAAPAAAKEQAAPRAAVPPAASAASTAVKPPPQPLAPPTKRSLDEVILDYLITGEEK